MQVIRLRKVDFLQVDDFIYKSVPNRMLYLDDSLSAWNGQTAYSSLERLCSQWNLVFSDIYRSPQASAIAYKNKRGTARPGDSGHNYGVSVDLGVDETLRRMGGNYTFLCEAMIEEGWTPYQGVQSVKGSERFARGMEDWHFNYIGPSAHNMRNPTFPNKNQRGSQVISWINTHYPEMNMRLSVAEAQELLRQLRFYQGAVDNIIGPMFRHAVLSFKRVWENQSKLPQIFNTDTMDPITDRILRAVCTQVIDENNQSIL